MTTPPYVTISGTSFEISQLNDRCKMLLGDLVKTVQEYRAFLDNYKQSLTLTSAYSGGLKSEVEKSDLPEISADVSDDAAVIKIEDKSYDASNMNDEIKQYVRELVRASNKKSQLEYRLRQLDAAKSAYTSALEKEVWHSGVSPMDPQPQADENSEVEAAAA